MYEYTLIRKKRKTVSLKLDKDGNITVVAPTGFTKGQAEKFILKNSAWIERKRTELAARVPMKKLNFSSGEKIPFLGKEYSLSLCESKKAFLSEGGIFLPMNAPCLSLKKFYSEKLKEVTALYLEKYTALMRVRPTRITVTSARTRWGSCSGKNAISFSFRLAMCDPFAVEYVVVHELCHILHKNHSKAFWKEVEKFYPDFRAVKSYLKKKAYYMEII